MSCRRRISALLRSQRSGIARAVSAAGIYGRLERIISRVKGGFILAYHDIPASRLVEHVEALRPAEPIPLHELIERQRGGRATAGLFAITSDDGVGSVVRTIAECASAHQWPVTFYLPTSYLDHPGGLPFQCWKKLRAHLPRAPLALGSRTLDLGVPSVFSQFQREVRRRLHSKRADDYVPFLRTVSDALVTHGYASTADLIAPEAISWPEVADLSRNPWIAFESHGVSHCALSALSDAEIEQELLESQRRISEHTNRPCRHFCYPFGGAASIGLRAPRLASRYYESAVTMERGRVRWKDRSLLPRVPLYRGDDGATAQLKVFSA